MHWTHLSFLRFGTSETDSYRLLVINQTCHKVYNCLYWLISHQVYSRYCLLKEQDLVVLQNPVVFLSGYSDPLRILLRSWIGSFSFPGITVNSSFRFCSISCCCFRDLFRGYPPYGLYYYFVNCFSTLQSSSFLRKHGFEFLSVYVRCTCIVCGFIGHFIGEEDSK